MTDLHDGAGSAPKRLERLGTPRLLAHRPAQLDVIRQEVGTSQNFQVLAIAFEAYDMASKPQLLTRGESEAYAATLHFSAGFEEVYRKTMYSFKIGCPC